LRKDGTVANLEGFDPDNGSTMVSSWEDITQIAMGQSHTVGLKEDGTVVAVGSNHCGQCDVEAWRDVVYIDAAVNRTIGMTKDGKLLIAGTVY
jgi:alpha-tubulin suppressor-like RCC1 family protein